VRGGDYVRSVFRDVIHEMRGQHGASQGAFFTAALEVICELESPQKEETLVRLVVLELEEERSPARRRVG
jgi:Ni,Fe-hydrogenase III large subunit